MRILVAEDHPALANFLRRGLESEGHIVQLAADGVTALNAFRNGAPDLTILDLNMPVKDGEHFLREIRMTDSESSILILTARPDIETRVRCLDCGADDFLLKPFSLFELRARCRSLLRRRRTARLVLRAGDLELNRIDHSATLRGAAVDLTNKEFALLEHLMLNLGHCMTRAELLEAVWKMDPAQTTNIVDVYVNYLRHKLKDLPPGQLIRTVRGKGYFIERGVSSALLTEPELLKLPFGAGGLALSFSTNARTGIRATRRRSIGSARFKFGTSESSRDLRSNHGPFETRAGTELETFTKLDSFRVKNLTPNHGRLCQR